MYPSRPVVRPDSSSSSIQRLCHNTPRPSGGLVGAAPLGVASVYGHSPLGATRVARRGKPAWGLSHMLALPHTSPFGTCSADYSCAHSCPCHAALRAFGRRLLPPSELGGSVLSCMRKKTGKLVTQKEKSRRCRQGRAQLTPRSGLVRHRCRRRPPSSSCANDPSMHGLDVSEGCYFLLPLSRNSQR